MGIIKAPPTDWEDVEEWVRESWPCVRVDYSNPEDKSCALCGLEMSKCDSDFLKYIDRNYAMRYLRAKAHIKALHANPTPNL